MPIKKRFRELLLPFQSQTKRIQSSIKKYFCFLHLACSYNYPYNPHYQSIPLLKLFFISLFHLFHLFYLDLGISIFTPKVGRYFLKFLKTFTTL